MCGKRKESVEHFGQCEALKQVFKSMRTIDGGESWSDQGLNLLGIQGRSTVKRGVSALHLIIWKHVIPEIVRVDTKGATFQSAEVLARAVRRYKKREAALKIAAKLHINRCESRGTVPSMDRFNKVVDGIAEVGDDGRVHRSAALQQWITDHAGDQDDQDIAQDATVHTLSPNTPTHNAPSSHKSSRGPGVQFVWGGRMGE